MATSSKYPRANVHIARGQEKISLRPIGMACMATYDCANRLDREF
jgi:hypothetical protein